MHVIDLDRPTARPVPRGRKSHLLVASALAIGAVLGASATYGWHERHHRGQRVAVFVFAEAGEVSDDAGSVVRDGRVATVTLTRQVTLVNAGPAPVTISDLSGFRPGVTVKSAGGSIAPGDAVQVDADIQVDCRRGLPLGRLAVTLSVRTADDRDQQSRPREGLDGTPWSERAEIACAGPPGTTRAPLSRSHRTVGKAQ